MGTESRGETLEAAESILASAPRDCPVLPFQTLDPFELARVRRDDRGAATARLAGDEDIVGTDRLPGALQFGPDDSGFTRIVLVERDPLQRPGQECLEPLSVGLAAFALGDPVPELERDNRRQEYRRFL